MAAVELTTGVAATIAAASYKRARVVYHYAAGVTVYLSLDGTTPTDPFGANPGIPLEAGSIYSDDRTGAPMQPIKAIQNSGGTINVFVQEA
jgi:hypothetical protein